MNRLTLRRVTPDGHTHIYVADMASGFDTVWWSFSNWIQSVYHPAAIICLLPELEQIKQQLKQLELMKKRLIVLYTQLCVDTLGFPIFLEFFIDNATKTSKPYFKSITLDSKTVTIY